MSFCLLSEGRQDDNQALVGNQQDSSHINPAYEGAADSPQKEMELKEVKPGNGSGGAANGGSDAKAQPDSPAGQNGEAKKETAT